MADGIHIRMTKKDAVKLLWILLLFEVFLVVVFVVDALLDVHSPLHKLFNLDSEATLPAWFSSLQLGLVGVIFLAVWVGVPERESGLRQFLLLVGLGFLFLSMDETAEFHEKLTRVLRHVDWLPQFKGGIWIPIYLSIAAYVGWSTRRTIGVLCKNRPIEMVFMLSGLALIVVGSVALEILTHMFLKDGQNPALYKIEVIIEEFFEMVGASVLLYGTILFALRNHNTLSDESGANAE